jgi:hypothetical protein
VDAILSLTPSSANGTVVTVVVSLAIPSMLTLCVVERNSLTIAEIQTLLTEQTMFRDGFDG